MNKTQLKENIKNAFEDFKMAIQKHPDINNKRTDGGWSVGEIADHIVKSTRVKLGATEKTLSAYDKNAASIRETFLNFVLKFRAAPFLQPESKRYSSPDLFALLDDSRNRMITMIDEDDLTDTCIDIELPVWGYLTKYEWLVLFENHIIRHTKQINEFNTAINQLSEEKNLK